MQPSFSEHWVIESKPDNVAEDLRLSEPWPELAAFASSFDLSALDDATYKHLPYGAASGRASGFTSSGHILTMGA